MKITLTIEVDDNKVTVTPVAQPTVEPVAQPTVEPVSQEEVEQPVNESNEDTSNKETEQEETKQEETTCKFKTIGEKLPKGRYATNYLPRTEQYPYNVKDAKTLLDEYKINISELAKAMGAFPAVKLRNIFRYDYRRFTKEEFDVILKAIDQINKEKEINL